MTTKTANVSKISCGHCVMTIEREVGELDGVSSVEADHVSKAVTISWNPGTTDWTAIQSRMEDIGYPAGD